MPLSASFVADFSSFINAAKEAAAAAQGFKESAIEMGPASDRNLEAAQANAEQIGRSLRRVGEDALAASKTFIDAYAEEQDAVNRLTSALQATGQATPAVIAAYSAMATQFQATTKYADESIISAEAVLTTIGKVGPEQMQLALTAVTNLASGMKIDLATAATMVAKAVGSGGESLGKLKVILGDVVQPGMDTAQMLQGINDKFSGAATNEMQTYNAQMQQFNNLLSDFNEKVGKVLVENLGKVFAAFQALPEPIQNVILIVGSIGTVLAPVLVSFSSLISILATPGVGAGLISAFTAILPFLGPVGLIAAGVAAVVTVFYQWDNITAIVQRVYEGIKTWLVDKFTGLVDMVKQKIADLVASFQNMYNTLVGHSIVPDTIDGIGDQFSRLDQEMVQPVQQASADTIRALAEVNQYTAQVNAILSRNSLFTSGSQYDLIARLPGPGSGGGGTSGPVTVNNTFNLVDTESNLARRVSELIMQTIRSGTQLGTT